LLLPLATGFVLLRLLVIPRVRCVVSWFHDRIGRKDAEKLLVELNNKRGTFIIRESETVAGTKIMMFSNPISVASASSKKTSNFGSVFVCVVTRPSLSGMRITDDAVRPSVLYSVCRSVPCRPVSPKRKVIELSCTTGVETSKSLGD